MQILHYQLVLLWGISGAKDRCKQSLALNFHRIIPDLSKIFWEIVQKEMACIEDAICIRTMYLIKVPKTLIVLYDKLYRIISKLSNKMCNMYSQKINCNVKQFLWFIIMTEGNWNILVVMCRTVATKHINIILTYSIYP